MRKPLLVCAILISAAMARENPFFPAEKSLTLPVTSNIPDTLPPLTALRYNLPNQARTLKEVSFTVQNVDGTIETHTLAVDKSIDWHTSLMVSQSAHPNRAVDSAEICSAPSKSSSSADFGFIRFDTKGKSLTLKSKDPMIRHFALTEPNRIVIDFKRKDIFPTKEKNLNAPPYVSVNVSNQGKFIRAVLVLDGSYDYVLKNSGGLISIRCK